MSAYGQEILFKKVRCCFDRATVGIPAFAKKRYRLTTDELGQIRNLSVLFAQVWPFLKHGFIENFFCSEENVLYCPFSA